MSSEDDLFSAAKVASGILSAGLPVISETEVDEELRLDGSVWVSKTVRVTIPDPDLEHSRYPKVIRRDADGVEHSFDHRHTMDDILADLRLALRDAYGEQHPLVEDD